MRRRSLFFDVFRVVFRYLCAEMVDATWIEDFSSVISATELPKMQPTGVSSQWVDQSLLSFLEQLQS